MGSVAGAVSFDFVTVGVVVMLLVLLLGGYWVATGLVTGLFSRQW